MTPDQIEASRAKAEGRSDDNPFKVRLLSRLGELHSSPPTDRESQHAHATAEAHSESACAV